MAAPLGRDTLPVHWSYGVCRDGRVFFVSDETQSTTWLHPRTGEPVNSGHMMRSDLPRGWEEGFTQDGASYFINHNQRVTAFQHPVTGQVSPENVDFNLQEPPDSQMSEPQSGERRPSSMVSESSTVVTTSTMDTASGSKGSRSSGKVHCFGKRDQAIKRNPNVPVVVRGWLYKQDSSGMRLWKRKWFVLSDFCLFYYKDSREETVLGSIPLPSYVVSPVEPDDHISRKCAFKACHTGMRSYIYNKNSVIGSQAEHSGMRTYFFSADTQEDMSGWVSAMNQAALMQGQGVQRESDKSDMSEKSVEVEVEVEVESLERQAVPQTNHINSCGVSPSQPEPLTEPDPAEPPGVEPSAEIRTDPGEEEPPSVRGPTPEVQSEARPPAGAGETHALSPDSAPPSRAPSTLPTAHRNGLPPPEQNGGGAAPRRVPTPRSDTERQGQRKSVLAQVEHWVKVQKGDPKSIPSAGHTLPCRTPPPQPRSGALEAYQSLPRTSRHSSAGSSPPPAPRNLPSDYKYAHDRLSHFRMSTDERVASREGTVWQLYEWQQRQRYRHGSPTAPVFADFADSPAFRAALEVPRCISVSASGSPRRLRSQLSKSSHTDRRSMPPIGYITHTVSAPSLHGKTVTGRETLKDRPSKPLKIAESDVDVKLSRLCEQDKILEDLETKMRTLKEDKDKLELVLDVSHQQMEQYQDQPAHAEKIAYQQRLLQEDVVHIRAEISRTSTEMEKAWDEYGRLELDLHQLRDAILDQMSRNVFSQQEKAQIRRELWRIEDVMAGLSSSKAHYQVTMDSVKNPERKLVPSVSLPSVPSLSMGETRPPTRSPHLSPTQLTPQSQPSQHALLQVPQGPALHTSVPNWVDDDAPRPPLPQLYSPDDPPAVPPLPKEASVIRHTSVRGLKRQSDERKRDREIGQGVNGDYKMELRSFLSEPELLGLPGLGATGPDSSYLTLPSRGVTGSTSRLNQSSGISSFVTLRRGVSAPGLKERPKSALERLYSGEPQHQRGRMSAEEQLERMKRHQKALVRERKRTLSQGERLSTTSSRASSSSFSRPLSADLASWRREQAFDLQLLERAVPSEERQAEGAEHRRPQSDDWLMVRATPVKDLDMEPLDYSLDLCRELSTPEKVLIPERYIHMESEEPLSQDEREARQRKALQIKSVLARSSVQNTPDTQDLLELDSVLQEKERIITISHALASEASQKSREVAAKAVCQYTEVLSHPEE
ncbi:hypothetical protein AAFF_G00015260 [Aldrovandia affinis]|uniref:Pleckstrin homology domain-containing family A member 7-like n=1 Tax=Aldrovandia affinis TaxID=143900 RepID=A0AAD7WH79_9TELE|nr:hypothetical protein AAFF_G00015260 [Aldrovandia affinis]